MVEFISYDGEYPNLCSGELKVRIDGEEVTFGYSSYLSWREYDKKLSSSTYNPRFWTSGGGVWMNDEGDFDITTDEWELDKSALKPEYQKYAEELIDCFNANVPYGCCGGCI